MLIQIKASYRVNLNQTETSRIAMMRIRISIATRVSIVFNHRKSEHLGEMAAVFAVEGPFSRIINEVSHSIGTATHLGFNFCFTLRKSGQ